MHRHIEDHLVNRAREMGRDPGMIEIMLRMKGGPAVTAMNQWLTSRATLERWPGGRKSAHALYCVERPRARLRRNTHLVQEHGHGEVASRGA